MVLILGFNFQSNFALFAHDLIYRPGRLASLSNFALFLLARAGPMHNAIMLNFMNDPVASKCLFLTQAFFAPYLV